MARSGFEYILAKHVAMAAQHRGADRPGDRVQVFRCGNLYGGCDPYEESADSEDGDETSHTRVSGSTSLATVAYTMAAAARYVTSPNQYRRIEGTARKLQIDAAVRLRSHSDRRDSGFGRQFGFGNG